MGPTQLEAQPKYTAPNSAESPTIGRADARVPYTRLLLNFSEEIIRSATIPEIAVSLLTFDSAQLNELVTFLEPARLQALVDAIGPEKIVTLLKQLEAKQAHKVLQTLTTDQTDDVSALASEADLDNEDLHLVATKIQPALARIEYERKAFLSKNTGLPEGAAFFNAYLLALSHANELDFHRILQFFVDSEKAFEADREQNDGQLNGSAERFNQELSALLAVETNSVAKLIINELAKNALRGPKKKGQTQNLNQWS